MTEKEVNQQFTLIFDNAFCVQEDAIKEKLNDLKGRGIEITPEEAISIISYTKWHTLTK